MDEFEVDACRLVESEMTRLRRLSHGEAKSLPESSESDVVIAQKAASLTVFRYADEVVTDDLPADHVLVVVLASRAQFFGMAQRHFERGLVFAPVGAARDATASELANSGGGRIMWRHAARSGRSSSPSGSSVWL
jgi:hypothetical protein